MRRRIIPFNQIVSALPAGKAGAKDPRRFVSGNVAGEQWDMEQFAQDQKNLYTDPPPQYSEAHANRAAPDGIVRTIPTRMNYVLWQATQTVDGVAVLLVPRNSNRLDLQFSTPASIGAGYFWGGNTVVAQALIIPQNGQLGRIGGVVPINDFWVVAPTGSPLPQPFFAYEGIEAMEANLQ